MIGWWGSHQHNILHTHRVLPRATLSQNSYFTAWLKVRAFGIVRMGHWEIQTQTLIGKQTHMSTIIALTLYWRPLDLLPLWSKAISQNQWSALIFERRRKPRWSGSSTPNTKAKGEILLSIPSVKPSTSTKRLWATVKMQGFGRNIRTTLPSLASKGDLLKEILGPLVQGPSTGRAWP